MLTISEFARLVGLAPSALRFYDDCGLLPPAAVDGSNGYRYYSPSQQPRAHLLRDLREIDLPLADVRVALDADPAVLADVVRAHLRTVEAKTAAARSAADHLLTQLLAEHTTVTLGGPEFASALRQVTPAAHSAEAPHSASAGAPHSASAGAPHSASAGAPHSASAGAPHSASGASPHPSTSAASSGPSSSAGSARPTTSAASAGSSASGASEVELEVLGCVLIELAADEVTFVATDRYRLAVRTVPVVEFGGPATRVLVRAEELAGVGKWAAAGEVVRLEVGADVAALVRGDETRPITVVDAEYPAYQGILDGLAPPVCRVVVDRSALLAALEGREVVALDINPDGLSIDDGPKLDVIGSGTTRIGFTAGLLAAALETSVGPDVLLEICAQDRPVVVRSADQGTFTTLVMPVRLEPAEGAERRTPA